MNQTSNANFFLKYKAALLLSLCAAFAYSHFFLNRAYVELQISTEAKTDFKIYWAGADKKFSESHMARITITPRTKKYSFFLTDLRKAQALRIDPLSSKGFVYLKDLVIQQQGMPTLHLTGIQGFAQLKPLGGLNSTEYTVKGWKIQSSDNDPRFELDLSMPPRTLNWPAELARFLLLISPLFFLTNVLSSFWQDYTYITYLAFFALALILTMAAVTEVDHHPDERVHYAATKYYQNHWLPPPVESPEIIDSYSDFGISRLNLMEVSYFFAGKFGQLLEPFHLSEVLSCRLFNVSLFAILVFLAFGAVRFRLFFLPMLLSPQIWYIFSYVNSDAFSLFVVLLTGWQMVNKESTLNRFLEQEQISPVKILGLGLLLALLIFVKKNYYFFTLFLLLFFAWRCFYYPFPKNRIMVKRLLVIVVLGIAFAGVRIGADIHVNGLDKKEKIHLMQERTAKPLFKPSTPLEEKFGSLLLRDRGVEYITILKVFRWGEKSFRTGFGAYGYLTALARDSYYDTVRWLGIASMLFMGLSIMWKSDTSEKILYGGAFLCSLGLIGTASYYAWTYDFQGQGRYLFPIIPIIGMILVQTEKVYNQLVLRILCTMMFFLAVFSFIFIGLYSLSKYGWA